MNHKDALKKIAAVLKKSSFSKQKFESAKLSDGTEVEYTALEPGGEISVKDAEGNLTPAPVGEHELEDGRIVIISEEGKIAEIKEAAPKDEEKKPEEMADESAAGEGKPAGGIDWTQEIKYLKEQLAWMAKQIATLAAAQQMFKADAAEVFEAFSDYVKLDSENGGKAITKVGQTVFSDVRKTKAEGAERFLGAMQKFNKRQREKQEGKK